MMSSSEGWCVHRIANPHIGQFVFIDQSQDCVLCDPPIGKRGLIAYYIVLACIFQLCHCHMGYFILFKTILDFL